MIKIDTGRDKYGYANDGKQHMELISMAWKVFRPYNLTSDDHRL